MRRTTEQRNKIRVALVLLLLMLNGLTVAVEVSWTGGVYPQNGVDVEHLSGSVVLLAEIENVNFTGLPDDEYEDGTCQFEYNWYVNGVLTSEHTDTITLANKQNNIQGQGVYNVRCEARCHLTTPKQDDGNDLWTDWKFVGQHNVTFFTLEFQRQDGTPVNSIKIAECGAENLNAVVTPNCSPVIILTKSSSNITAFYQIPGLVTIGSNELGAYGLFAQYRGRTIVTLAVNVLEAYVQLTIVP